MLTQNHIQRRIVAQIDSMQILKIKAFIQGAVYCYCKNNPDSYFAARDLFGGENYDWSETPLQVIHDWHKLHKAKDPVSMAGKDIGWLLLEVLIEDKREFELKEGYTNQYRWTGR